jgi:DNA-binding NarL/FixJ family response regulator
MAKSGNTKVLIVDEHPLFSKGLSSLLESSHKFNITGTAVNIADAVKIAEKEKPALVIMEIRLGNENGMDLIPKLRAVNPEIVILILSIQDERYYSERVLRLGARGYVMKSAPEEKIMEAVLTVLDGKIYLGEDERERIFQTITGENSKTKKGWTMSLQELSNRELQVFSLMGKGYGTIEIASKLNLSTKTIDTHREHIKSKFHCNSSQELRQMAIEWSSHSGNI